MFREEGKVSIQLALVRCIEGLRISDYEQDNPFTIFKHILVIKRNKF